MSKATVIVALVIAVVLAAAALLLTRGDPQALPPGPVLGLEAARVREVRTERAGGRFESADRNPGGEWVITIGAGAASHAWPAEPTRVRAALRILSTLEFDRPADRGDAVGADAATVRIVLDDGSERMIRFSPGALAGRVLAEVERPDGKVTGWVDTGVRDMLVTSGPREWRDTAALAITPDISRIIVQGQAGTVSLARVQGRWALREPFQEPAEPDSIARLSSTLAGITVTDFLDDGAPAHTGLDTPGATLIVEADVRDSESAPIRTVRQSLLAGAAADLAGNGIFAAVERAGTERTVVVSAASLAAISTDPAAYVARRAVQAGDAGQVVIEHAGGQRTYARTIDGWERRTPEAGPVPPAEAQRLGALLDLLTKTPAETVLTAAPSGLEPLAMVYLKSLGGADLASVEIGRVTGADGALRLVVAGGPVWRVYGKSDGDAVLRWLAESP